MNWAGLSVMLGLVYLAFIHPPWSLLVLLVFVPQFWRLVLGEKQRADAAKPSQPATAPARPSGVPSPVPVHPVQPQASVQGGPTPPVIRLLDPPPPITGGPSLGVNVDTPPKKPAAPPPPAAAESSAGKRDHFTRHAMTPGWLYVASKEFHQDDLFKVGYTTLHPLDRIYSLNLQAQGVTAAVGRFTLEHQRRVPCSQLAEQRVFELLATYRVSAYREFFRAPLPVIVAAVEAVAAEMEATTLRPVAKALPQHWATCPECGRVSRFSAYPSAAEIELACPPCGAAWTQRLDAGP